MKKIITYICLTILLFNNTLVYAKDTARSTVVIDIGSGRILYSKNKDEKRLIASITKIMTAVIAIENKNLDDIVTVGEEVLPMYGSNIYIKVGEQLTLRDLLYGLMLRSGNDAAVTIATYVSGSEVKFVELMNKKAKEIGMKNTTFMNCHGLDEETQNYSTAYDMALLSKYANRLMEYVEISGTKKYKLNTNYNSYLWINRNKLLSNYRYATGGKTGFTPKAGRTLVTTANKNNLNLSIVTLDDNDMYNTHESLYDYYFSKYENVLLIDKDNIKFDNSKYSNLYIKNDFYYPLTKEEQDSVKIIVDLYDIDVYSNNDKVGEIYVLLNNEEIYRDNIYIKKYNQYKPNLFDKIINFFSSIFD